jgi:hypothetical protein
MTVVFAPSGVERVGPVRRRASTLASSHLPRALVAAVSHETDDDERPSRFASGLTVRIAWKDGGTAMTGSADHVHFAAVFGEFVGVTVDLCVAAGLPFLAARPAPDGEALDVVVGSMAGIGKARLGDALVLFAVAVRTAALARGFDVVAELAVENADGGFVVDGRIEEYL